MNTKTLNHSVKRAITGVTLFILLVTKTLYGVTDHRPTLKELFHNPVNLNKVTEERITRSLRLLLLSELKIKRIIIYVHTIKKRKLESFESMVQDRIITSQEAVILSRFTFLKERSGYHLFEEELESEYSSSGDRVHDPDFKINLNRFESETLLSLRFMDEKTVRAITRFRVLNGRFNSIYELLLIPELDPVIFLRLKPFLVRLKADKQKNKSSLELRIRRGKQQLEPVQENKHYYYTRANISLGNGIDLKLSGIKSEDQVAGYPASLLSGSLGDFNYYRQYSIALYLEKKELPISFLALGDYYLRFGQHLLFGGTFPAIIDKIDTHPIKKRDYGISSFQNPNRIGALRGLAFAVPVGQFKITAFSFSNSYELTKGRFLNDGVNVSYEGMVTDISVMADDKSLSDRLVESGAGVNVVFKGENNVRVGATAAYIYLSHIINPENDVPDDRNKYRGDELYLSSVYYDVWISEYIDLFGEVAVSSYENYFQPGDRRFEPGAVLGGILDTSFLKYSLMMRYLAAGFHSPHSGAVIDRRRDEKGIIQGVYVPFTKNLSFRVYFDMNRDMNDSPVSKELNGKLAYKVTSDLLLSYVSAYYIKWDDVEFNFRTKNQVNLEYWITGYVSFRLRYETILSDKDSRSETYEGNLFYAQLKTKWFRMLTAIIRVTWYDVDHFDAAVYALENLLPYWFNGVKSYNGRGVHYDVILMSEGDKLRFGVKYNYEDREEPGELSVTETLYIQMIYTW